MLLLQEQGTASNYFFPITCIVILAILLKKVLFIYLFNFCPCRHCLWILGNERTLINSESIWKELVCDAKRRQCFFNVDEDEQLAKTILEVKKEFDQLDDLLNGNSVFFRSARWKVYKIGLKVSY